jgi:DNA modification methylase
VGADLSALYRSDVPVSYYADDWLTVHLGDCREVMATMEPESVHCVVTSPPFWGLRDYGTPGQLGLEPTPEAYVESMVAVFREVRRVLRSDGTVWLNLGDSYAGTGKGPTPPTGMHGANGTPYPTAGVYTHPSLKGKDLVGIPWRVAFALQADGWVLRSEVIWAKPNPMPESVTDRPTKSHEQMFMFSKGKRIGPDPTKYDDISDADAQWLAGLLDCEGSIVIRREAQSDEKYGQHAAQMSIGSTSRALLERVAAIVGEGNVLERDGQNAPMHYWQLSHKRALGLLRRLYPFLIVKQAQARCAIALEERKSYRGGVGITKAEVEFRERCWQAVKSLNHFGSPDLDGIPEPVFGRWTSQPYYFDADAVREPSTGQQGAAAMFARPNGTSRDAADGRPNRGGHEHRPVERVDSGARNIRSVWTIATQPYPGAHFATFPQALVEPCIKAGCPQLGTVLDPFAGSGTTGLVAQRLSRRAVLIDLNGDYLQQVMDRNRDIPLGLGA